MSPQQTAVWFPRPISLAEWMVSCRTKSGPPLPAVQTAAEGEFAHALVKLATIIGGLEPLSASRPGACEPVSVFDDVVDVPPATIDENGNVVPSERKLIKICAPMHMALVVDKLRARPENLTAVESGEILFPRLGPSGFSEGFCLPYEPGDGDNVGVFYNVEHIILCPKSGFDIRARNHSTTSNALFSIHAELWGSC